MDLQVFRFSAMAGENEIQIVSQDCAHAEQVATKAIEEVRRIERTLSRYQPDSELSRVNAAAGQCATRVDDELASLFDYADACFRQSDGLFDITSGVLRRVWNFRSGQIPAQRDIQGILPLIGWNKVTWKRPWLFMPHVGMELDLGGIGKEYAVDRVAGILLGHGLKNSLVNLAGDVRVCGPRAPGVPWQIGIAEPEQPSTLRGAVQIESGAAATSGDYERKIEIGGRRYSHLLNPRTGWPTDGFQSVTVFAESCLIAGSITTTAMLLGKKGERYLNDLGVPYVAVTSDGSLIRAASLAPRMRSVDEHHVQSGSSIRRTLN